LEGEVPYGVCLGLDKELVHVELVPNLSKEFSRVEAFEIELLFCFCMAMPTACPSRRLHCQSMSSKQLGRFRMRTNQSLQSSVSEVIGASSSSSCCT